MRAFSLCLIAFLTAAPAAQAQQLLESYTAFLGTHDHFNSNGIRLTEPWQIIRQDRANYHRYRIRDAEDQSDRFFGSIANRALAEQWLANGSISASARHSIVNREVIIDVDILGYGNTATAIRVNVR